MSDIVELGADRLPGEVVAIRGDVTTVQAYEYTGGLAPGHPARARGRAAVGAARPAPARRRLRRAAAPARRRARLAGARAVRGPAAGGQEFDFTPEVTDGAVVTGGTCLGTVAVAGGIGYRVLVPPALSGRCRAGPPGRAGSG